MAHTTQFVVYTVDELAELFQTSRDWVRRGVQSQRFPHLRLGGKRGAVRFTTEHVHEIAAMHEQRPKTAAEQDAPEAPATTVMDMSVFGTSKRSRTRQLRAS